MIKNLQLLGGLLMLVFCLPQVFGANQNLSHDRKFGTENLEKMTMIPFDESQNVPNMNSAGTRADAHNWEYIGEGEWSDPFYVWGDTGESLTVTIFVDVCAEHPGEIRVRDKESDLFYEDYYPIFYCPMASKVYVGRYTIGNSDGTYMHFMQVCEELGFPTSLEYGKVEGNVITIPGTSIGIYNPDDGKWYYYKQANPLIVKLPSNWQNNIPTATGSGIYFGITAFNYLPEIKPMDLLTCENKKEYKDFVDSRMADDYTYLYYSAEQALNTLKSKQYPDDLSKVTLITFTDGNDDGSLSEAPSSWDDLTYQRHIENLITEAKVQGVKVDAYSIGLKGQDIGDYNYDMFKSNLQALATDPKEKNATEVGNMREVENTLNEIIDGLETSWLNKKVSCNINMRATGDKIRFTLDKTRAEMENNPDNSNLWIEGVFSRDDNSMNEIEYHGCSSTSGSKVISKEVQIDGKTKYQFTFENLKDLEGEQLKTGEINFWHATKSNPVWQPHTEFGQGSDAVTETERASAAIMFVMDCSSSLGDDFDELKRVVNSLIDRLAPDPAESGITEVDENSEGLVEYYNLQGIKVDKPSLGIYIMKQGRKIQKVLLTE